MNATTRTAVIELRRADPAPHRNEDLDRRAEVDLARIIASPRQGDPAPVRSPRRVRARVAVAVGVTTALAAGAFAVGSTRHGGPPAYAATPDRLLIVSGVDALGFPASADAATLLSSVAAKAARLPDDTGTGRYARIETDAWALWTRVTRKTVTSDVVPQTTTRWTARDGSGRLAVRRDGPGTAHGDTDSTVAPGGQSLMWPLGSLSADDQELARQLDQAHPAANGPAERLVAVADAVAEQPLPPAVRAAVLRYLARTPGLAVDGVVRDRAGREGIAVHVDTTMTGLPERRTLIVDPVDGRILGAETLLTRTAGKLNVPSTSVISYTTSRAARYTDDLR